jgi:hypothetical protein
VSTCFEDQREETLYSDAPRPSHATLAATGGMSGERDSATGDRAGDTVDATDAGTGVITGYMAVLVVGFLARRRQRALLFWNQICNTQ